MAPCRPGILATAVTARFRTPYRQWHLQAIDKPPEGHLRRFLIFRRPMPMTRRDGATAPKRFIAKCCKRVPDHADALHLLGLIAHQRGTTSALDPADPARAGDHAGFPARPPQSRQRLEGRGPTQRSPERAIIARSRSSPTMPVARCNLAAVQTEQGAIRSGPGERRSRDCADARSCRSATSIARDALLG